VKAIAVLTFLSLSAALSVVGGCAASPESGYALSSTYPSSVATVHVPIFENATYDRNIEFELTDAIVKEIQASTPYRLAGASSADTILLGRISRVERESLSRSRETGLSEEVIVSVTIDFEWRDLRSGKTIVARDAFTGDALFVPSRPSSEPIELGQFAVVQQLARDVVTELRSAW
jgi:hypothetical protein